MGEIQSKRFDEPDEEISDPRLRGQIVVLGETYVGRDLARKRNESERPCGRLGRLENPRSYEEFRPSYARSSCETISAASSHHST